ncbi:hypothetical protein OBBRIDRAFT_731078, partial [Obba rivulosa]
VLDCSCKTILYCSTKKTNLFCTEINFFGHHLLHYGLELDAVFFNVYAFLSLVCYFVAFLSNLAEYICIFTLFIIAACDKLFIFRRAYVITSANCLTIIDYYNFNDNYILLHLFNSPSMTAELIK